MELTLQTRQCQSTFKHFYGVLPFVINLFKIFQIMFSNSEYFRSLSLNDKSWYQKKLTLSDGNTLPHPYSLPHGWKSDVTLMPDITWPHVYNYLINTPSTFSKESLKAYKSLEAFNFYENGHVQDVYYHSINEENCFCFIKSEVSLIFY